MRIRRRQRKAEPPRGVRIVHGDGTVSECTLVRDPHDADGCAQWIAVPPDGTVVHLRSDHLQIDYLPGKTAVSVSTEVVG